MASHEPGDLKYRPKISNFQRYLSAKKRIDDRSLNLHVWEEFSRLVRQESSGRTLMVLEIGAGIGTMLERLLESGVLRIASYMGVDSDRDSIEIAGERLPHWAREQNFRVVAPQSHQGEEDFACFSLEDETRKIEACFRCVDLFDLVEEAGFQREWDVLFAHAFLDLVDVPSALPGMFSFLRPGGIFYFTLNFDGLSIFEPPIDPGLDAKIMRLYHQSMDERMARGKPSGDHQTGRHLFSNLRQAGARIAAAGSSDWVVFPDENGYPEGEAEFLRQILRFFSQSLGGHPDLNPEEFSAWLSERSTQIERAELIYIAHQLDFVGIWPGLR